MIFLLTVILILNGVTYPRCWCFVNLILIKKEI